MLIDSHCHIHDKEVYQFAISRQQAGKKLHHDLEDEFGHYPLELTDFADEKIISRAHKNDVKKMICIGTSHKDSLCAKAFAEKYARDGVFWSYGVHPDEAIKVDTVGPRLESASSRLVAVGEIGLDYRNGTSSRSAQIRLFERMLDLAKSLNLPCIFHVRDAFDDFFAVLKNFPGQQGVVHSFSDSPENLAKSLNSGFFIGVNGLSTFANLPEPPLERILLETDAPFLTPVPFRGTINEPAHIKEIAQWISNQKGVPVEEIARQTTKNATELFRI